MTQATSLTSRWYSAPRLIEAEGRDAEDRPFWKVEGVTIRLAEGDKLELSAPRYGAQSALRVEVGDGELRFPLEDLVPLVLERLDIAELSQMICGDERARRSILDALARYYNEHYIEDADRRFWIASVQAAIHDKKLDELTYTMARIEQACAQMGYRAMQDIAYGNALRHELRDALQAAGQTFKEADAAGIAAEARYDTARRRQDLAEFKTYVASIGTGRDAWNDARDHWRGQLKALFANVQVPEEVVQWDGGAPSPSTGYLADTPHD